MAEWEARIQNVSRRGFQGEPPPGAELLAPASMPPPPTSLEELQRWALLLSIGASAVGIMTGLAHLMRLGDDRRRR